MLNKFDMPKSYPVSGMLRFAPAIEVRRLLVAMLAFSAAILCLFAAGHQAHAASCTFASAGDNDFNNAANWSCGNVPGSGDDVFIPFATTTGLSANATFSSLSASGTLYAGPFNLTVTSTATLDATSTVTSTSGIITFGGPVSDSGLLGTFNGGFIFQDTITLNGLSSELDLGTGSSTFLGALSDLYQGGLINMGSGTFFVWSDWNDSAGSSTGGVSTAIFKGGAAQFLYENGAVFVPNGGFNHLTIDKTGGAVTIGGNTYVDHNFTITNGTVNLGSQALYVGGDWSDSGTFNGNAGTVILNGGGAQSVGQEAGFYDLTIAKGAGTATLSGEVTSTHALTISAGTLALGSNTLHVGGNWSDSGTLNGGTGTVDMDGSGSQSIGAEPNFYNLTINSGGIVTVGGATAVHNDFTINSGSLASNFPLYIGGNWSDPAAGFSGTGDTQFNGTGAQSIGSEPNFYRLVINKSSGTSTMTGDATTTFVELDAGGFDLGGNTIHVGANWFDAGSLFTASGGTVDFNGGGISTISAEPGFYNVTFNMSGGSETLTGNITIANNLTLNSGVLDGGNDTIFMGGNWSDPGAVYNGSAFGTVEFDGAASQIGTEAGFGDLIINSSGTSTLLGDVTSSNSVFIENGTLDMGGFTIHDGGSWTDTGALVPNGGTADFNGPGFQTVDAEPNFFNVIVENGFTTDQGGNVTVNGTFTMASSSEWTAASHLLDVLGAATIPSGSTVTSTSGVMTFTGGVTLGGNLGSQTGGFVTGGSFPGLLNSGTIDIGSGSSTVGGTLTNSGTINGGSGTLHIGGSFSDVGTFNAGSGTVSFDGTNQTIGGNTTFFNLTKTVTSAATLTFNAGSTQIVQGTATLQGAAGNLLSLRSTVPGTQANFDPQGTRNFNYLDVQDNHNINATVISLNGATNVDSGNNINWSFAPNVPLISPPGGIYASPQTITITSAGASSIRFSNNGVDPTCSTGLAYSAPFLLNFTTTIKAIGCAGGVGSPVAASSYSIPSSGSSGSGTGGGGATIPSSSGVANGVVPQQQTLFENNLLNLQNIGVAVHSLVKLPCTGFPGVNDPCKAVYYVGADGKRHAFPNEKVYFTWYTDFNGVQLINSAQMASIPLGANVTYKPGVKMVKFTTDNKVYVVQKGGILRWVTTADLAAALYGSNWIHIIDDISDAFYTNYQFGTDVNSTADYSPSAAEASVTFPSDSLQM
jgi:hypothetical protein